jgi:hypothetical protein
MSKATTTKAEFIAKYGNVQVKFSRYYKYAFDFTATLPDKKIEVAVGRNSDDIYRFEVKADHQESIASLDPFWGKCGDDEFYEY